MAVLEQACRNERGYDGWFVFNAGYASLNGPGYDDWRVVISPDVIRAEYHRLLKLKRAKKKWRQP